MFGVMRRIRFLLVIGIVGYFASMASVRGASDADGLAREILDKTGVRGGLVVHIGCGDGKLTAALRANERYVVYGLDADIRNVSTARQHILGRDLYGPVSVDQLEGKRLPFIDNVANLVVAEDQGVVVLPELMRVLAPLGVAYVKQDGKWKKSVKPWPKDIDEWTHYLHSPNNNAVANDTVVAPPKRLQWVGGPLWSRAHSTVSGTPCMVSARGRIFTIEDLAPIELPLLPGKYTLVARDAFNGIVLWKRQLDSFESITHWMKATPVQLSRRLVAIGDRVYATMGIFAPVTVFDAATGEVLKVYEGTEKTQEIVCSDGVLYLVIGDPYNPVAIDAGKDHYRPNYAVFGEEHYSPARPPKERTDMSIVAIDAASGKVLWKKSGPEIDSYQATTLSVHGDRLAYQTGSELVYANRKEGSIIWKRATSSVMEGHDSISGAAPTLVLLEKAIVRSDAKNLVVFSTKDGAELWRTETAVMHHSSSDAIVVGDVVWDYPNLNGHDLLSGKVVMTRRETRDKPMGHDRCYRNKATVNYLINSRSGGADFSGLNGEDFSRAHPWIRGTCSLGIMPCNGLLYGSPHACSCVNETKLNGFYALSGTVGDEGPNENPLERGPAYGRDMVRSARPSAGDWPAYRRGPDRSGAAKTLVGADVTPAWTADIPSPTAPVVAAGRLLVAAKDAHTLHSLNVADGKAAWTFTAGGRIDSPPTFADGRVLFGSADGWVYCLAADTGELVWRFRAAPQPGKTVAFGQVESLWPVHGSVLVLDGTAYFSAGRSSFIDGGIYLYGVDVVSGKKKHETCVAGPYEEDGESVFDPEQQKQIMGTIADILVSDGSSIYLRHMAFTKDLAPLDTPNDHLLTVSGFLDKSGHHRSYWTVAPRLFYDTDIADNIDADLLVTEGSKVFGTRISASGRGPEVFDPRERGFVLFGMTRDPERAAALRSQKVADIKASKKAKTKAGKKEASSLAKSKSPYIENWSTGIDVNGKAMVKTGDLLFVAGTPNEYPDGDLYHAVEGRSGGILTAISASDGETVATYPLKARPTWDGMAAANERLFISLESGEIQCWKAR